MKPVERKIHEKHMHRDILSLPSQANTGQAFREEKTHSLTHSHNYNYYYYCIFGLNNWKLQQQQQNIMEEKNILIIV